MFRPVHLLWLTVPLAAWLGWHTPGNGLSPTGKVPPPSPSPSPPPLEMPVLVRAVDGGLETATAAQLRERYAAVRGMADEGQKGTALELLCARWAEVDPAAGMAFLLSQPEDTRFPRNLLVKEWALLDSGAAWAYLENQGGTDNEAKAAVTFLLLHEDPDEFFSWYSRQPGLELHPRADDPAWLAVARRHFSELEAIVSKHLADSSAVPGSHDAAAAQNDAALLSLLATVLAEKDPKAAIEWARGLPGNVRKKALQSALFTVAKADPAAATREVLALCKGDPSEWMGILSSPGEGNPVLLAIGNDSPTALLDLEKKVPALDSLLCLRAVFSSAVNDGKISALDAYRALASGDDRERSVAINTLPQMWDGLSSGQLDEAARAIAGEPSSSCRQMALAGIMTSWFASDAESAMKFAASLPDEGLRRTLYSGVSDVPSARNPQRLVEILQQVPAADRVNAFENSPGASGSWNNEWRQIYGGETPDLAVLSTVLDGVPPSSELNHAAAALTYPWAQNDPRAALVWAAGLADPSAREAAVASAIGGWALNDSGAAGEWLAAQPAGALRDAATVSLINRVQSTQPDSAWQWAGMLGNAELRKTSRLNAFGAWAKADPDAAAAALEAAAATLSESEVASLRQTLPP